LLAQSDVEQSQTRILRRAGAAGHRLSIDHSRHPGRGRRAGVWEWSATFDCDAGRRGELTATLAASFEKWLESLRDIMAG
jgi:hypothetical protein